MKSDSFEIEDRIIITMHYMCSRKVSVNWYDMADWTGYRLSSYIVPALSRTSKQTVDTGALSNYVFSV